jgi:hypothetical protein
MDWEAGTGLGVLRVDRTTRNLLFQFCCSEVAFSFMADRVRSKDSCCNMPILAPEDMRYSQQFLFDSCSLKSSQSFSSVLAHTVSLSTIQQ